MRKLALITSMLALAGAVVFPSFALADPPEKTSFDDTVSQTLTGICAFPVDVVSSFQITFIDYFDSSGALVRRSVHITEQDTFSANGKSLTGEPFTFNNFISFDENGETTAVLARGVAEKVRLPSGELFVSAGVIDFLAQDVEFSLITNPGRTGDIDAFCAALSP